MYCRTQRESYMDCLQVWYHTQRSWISRYGTVPRDTSFLDLFPKISIWATTKYHATMQTCQATKHKGLLKLGARCYVKKFLSQMLPPGIEPELPAWQATFNCWLVSQGWGQHISEITSKATRTLGFLQRNLTFAPRETKAAAYKTLIRPQLEYAATIWHPYVKTQAQQRGFRGRLPGGLAGDGGMWAVLVICWTSWNSHPWNPTGCSPL